VVLAAWRHWWLRLLRVDHNASGVELFCAFFAVSAQSAAVVAGFFLPFSTTATEILLSAFVLFWLLSGHYREKIATILRSKVALVSLVMAGLLVLGLTYTSAPPGEALGVLLRYRRFLYIPLLLTAFQAATVRRHAIYAFQSAMLLVLAASLVLFFARALCGSPDNCCVFKNHITQNVLMAFFVGLTACRLPRNRLGYWLAIVAILLASFNILFMVDGRTGYLALFGIAAVVLYRRIGVHGLVLTAVAAACVCIAGYCASANFRHRINLALAEVQTCRDQDLSELGSSIGRRAFYYRTSAVVVGQHPLLGAGTGCYRTELQRHVREGYNYICSNPHSDYFNIVVQTGLVGLAVFLFWIYAQWQSSRRLPADLAGPAQSLIVTFVLGGLFNSLLMDVTEACLFCYFTGLCHAGQPMAPAPQHGGLAEETDETEAVDDFHEHRGGPGAVARTG
jgi:O-antigen ligase